MSKIYDCMASMRLLRISVTMRLGCALRSLKMLSITEISVEVVSKPQNAALQFENGFARQFFLLLSSRKIFEYLEPALQSILIPSPVLCIG